jgi:hypothetical protein
MISNITNSDKKKWDQIWNIKKKIEENEIEKQIIIL